MKKKTGGDPINLGQTTGKVIAKTGSDLVSKANKELKSVPSTKTTDENRSKLTQKVEATRKAGLRMMSAGQDAKNAAVVKTKVAASNKGLDAAQATGKAKAMSSLGVKKK